SSIGSAHSGSVASGVFLSTRVRGYWYSADIYPVARGPTEHAPGSAPTHRNECVAERGRPGASAGGGEAMPGRAREGRGGGFLRGTKGGSGESVPGWTGPFRGVALRWPARRREIS